MMIRFAALRLAVFSAFVLFSATAYGQTRFDPLFRLTNIKGTCLVRAPGATAFVPAVNRKAYPYGTAVQVAQASEAVVLFSPDNSIMMFGPAEASVEVQSDNAEGRTLRLTSGEARTFIDEGLPEKAITVETPVATCDAFSGRSTIKLSRDADTTLVLQVEAASGNTRVTGPQFTVAKLKTACILQIRSSPDRSLTRLVNNGGDYTIALDNGTGTPVQFESTSKASVKIWREYAPVGGRLIVSVFAVGPDGKGRECYAFAVGQPAVASSGMPAMVPDASTTASNAVAPVGTAPSVQPAAGSIF
jgi:hypothetical protein